MRDYKEITDSVLQRSAEILENKRRRRKVVIRAGSAATGFCLLVLLGTAVWRGGMSSQEDGAEEQYAVAGDHNGESDVVIGDTDCFLPDSGAKDDGNGTAEEKKLIYSYSYDEGAVYCYAEPENGVCYRSVPLTHAIEKYGNDALYRVVVEIFCDEKAIEANSEAVKMEADRLFGLGYAVAVEEDGEEERCYFTLLATQEQLTDFAVNGEYGYMIYLYDECVR